MDPFSWIMIGTMIAGAVAGGWSYLTGNSKKNSQIDDQIDYLDAQWEDTQEKALKKADQEDTSTTLQEAVLGTEANGALRQLGMQQEADALAYNQAEMQRDASEGAALSSMAQSGTKNSSALNAVQMSSDVSEQQIQMQEDQNRLNEDVSLANVMSGLMTGADNLQTRRTEANDLREDYSDGGTQYNLYQMQRNMMQKEKVSTFSSDWWNGLATSVFGGSSTGLSFGESLSSTISKWSSDLNASETAQADTGVTFDLAQDNISNINLDTSGLFNMMQNNFGSFKIQDGGLDSVNRSLQSYSNNLFSKSNNRYGFSWN